MGAKGTHTVDTTVRLQNLRRLMRQGDINVDAYVVPSEDQRTCHGITDVTGAFGNAVCDRF